MSLPTIKGVKATIPLLNTARPVAQRARKIPAPLEEAVVRQLKSALEQGTIEKAEEFSGWQHPLVIVFKKSGDIRVCVDLRPLNQFVIRQPQPFPTFDELSVMFHGATLFSKLDIQDAFHQVELDPDCRNLTTFISSLGTFRSTRLAFGLANAPETFQRIMQQKLGDLPGLFIYMDDMGVFGRNKGEHDDRLASILKRLDDINVRINLPKCVLARTEIEFLGFVVSERGIAPSPAKVKALKECRPPTSKAEVQSFLGIVHRDEPAEVICNRKFYFFVGMISYVGQRFIQNLANKTEHLRKLTHKGVKFEWGAEHQQAFELLKQSVEEVTCLSFYSLTDETILYADASPYALGAVLIQVTEQGSVRPIAFASKTLNEADRKLAQIEKEAMAQIWATEHFAYYLRGRMFTLLSDHKPLQDIFKFKSSRSALTSARIERWLLRIQEFSFRIKYVQGKQMIADFLSRACSPVESESFDADTEVHINLITERQAEAVTIEAIRNASKLDKLITTVATSLSTGTWAPELRKFQLMETELSNVDGVLLRGMKIWIPGSLTRKVLEIVHLGHPGICRMKSRLRTKYWWPGIDKEVEEFVKNCDGCRLVAMTMPAEPLKRTELPEGPWEYLGMDFLGPLPSGEKLLVVVDYYSRFVSVAIMRETSAEKVIQELEVMFNIYGYPDRCIADNGPPFGSKDFQAWAASVGITLIHSIPYQPRCNGEVERVNRSLVKAITIGLSSGNDWRKELQNFLVSYHQTPHSITGVAPAELFFKRKVRDKLATVSAIALPDQLNEEVADRDRMAKMSGKEYADNKFKHRVTDLVKGDVVLMKRQAKLKWQTKHNPMPFTVLQKEGSKVTIVGSNGKVYVRDVSHLTKLFKRPEKAISICSSDAEVVDMSMTEDEPGMDI